MSDRLHGCDPRTSYKNIVSTISLSLIVSAMTTKSSSLSSTLPIVSPTKLATNTMTTAIRSFALTWHYLSSQAKNQKNRAIFNTCSTSAVE